MLHTNIENSGDDDDNDNQPKKILLDECNIPQKNYPKFLKQ